MVGIIGVKKLIGYLLNLIFLAGWVVFFLLQGRLAFCYLVDGLCCAKCDASHPMFFYNLLIFIIFLWAFCKMARPFLKTLYLKSKLKYLSISGLFAILWWGLLV